MDIHVVEKTITNINDGRWVMVVIMIGYGIFENKTTIKRQFFKNSYG
jgi:hypothetical protein